MVLLSFPKKSRESDFFSKFMLVLRVFCYHPYPGLSIFCHVPIFPKKGTTKLILQRITANVLTSAHLRSCSWFMVIYEQWVYIEYKVYIHTNSPTRSHHQLLNQIEWDRSKFDLRVSFETMDKATLIEHGQCRLWLQSQKRESQKGKENVACWAPRRNPRAKLRPLKVSSFCFEKSPARPSFFAYRWPPARKLLAFCKCHLYKTLRTRLFVNVELPSQKSINM